MNEHMASAILGVSTDLWIRDMQFDTQRTARRLAELGNLFSTGVKQRRFFEQAETLLKSRSSEYYPLLKKLCTSADAAAIRTFGIAFGYHALSRGASRRRAAIQSGCSGISFAAFAHDATPETLARTVAERHPLGTGAYFVYPDESADPDALCEVMRQNRECAFVVFDATGTFADRLPLNAMRFLPAERLLQGEAPRSGALYGAFASYDACSLPADTSLNRIAALSRSGCLFYVLTAAKGTPSAVMAQAARAVTAMRRNLPYPLFPVSLETDINYVDAPVPSFLPQFASVT